MPHVLIVEGKPRTLPHRNGFQSILVSIAKLGSVMTMALLALSASQKIMVNTTKSTLKASVGASGTGEGSRKQSSLGLSSTIIQGMQNKNAGASGSILYASCVHPHAMPSF
jgi:hypothetical protein